MNVEEGGLWTDIVRDAEEYMTISDSLFDREFGADLQSVEQRCFFIVHEGDAAVGTISAWYNHDAGWQDYGLVHWVAVRPASQGIGLGKAGLSFTLNRMAQWHERAMLRTATQRLRAVRLYLDFGFLPDMEQEGAVEIWTEVHVELGHPALERVLQR